jgi:hypothetical protein
MYQSLNNNCDEPVNIDIEAGNACIICFEVDDKAGIDIKDIKKEIKKCSCTGYVHVSCINKWYNNKRKIKCIMCNTPITRVVSDSSVTERQTPPTRPRQRPNFTPTSCKLMFLVVITTVLIVIVFFYPDAFQSSLHQTDNDGNENVDDASYLQDIMVGQY